jgi:6-phosphogluconolactonase
MTIEQHRFDDRDAMLDALYQVFVGDIGQALQQDSSATLLLSGGSTPAPLYRRLSQAALDWQRVHVALVDERWVEPTSEASNERLLRETLLTNAAADACFTGMKNDASSPFDGAEECNRLYDSLPLPHTLCLLGMGADGHTASLFPGAQGLEEALGSERHCAPILARRSAVTGDLLERMTLTPWSILQSRRLLLLITGEEKLQVLEQALQAPGGEQLPIAHIAARAPTLEVYWSP